MGNYHHDHDGGGRRNGHFGVPEKKGGLISSGGKLSGGVGSMVVHIKLRKSKKEQERTLNLLNMSTWDPIQITCVIIGVRGSWMDGLLGTHFSCPRQKDEWIGAGEF